MSAVNNARYDNGGQAMKKSLILSASLALCLGAATAAQSREICHDVRVKHIQSQDNHRLIGTGVGAVAGGLLGHQIGGGKGKTLATVGGAVAGGVVGNKVQQNAQNKKAYYTTERRCEHVDD
jgi:uncharacterized protein YcfJ